MNELITISTNDQQQPIISGRELHEFLETETPYRLWFPRMAEYGFAEGVDYTPYNFVHPQNAQEVTDHALTLDMAKELCMIQRTEKGKQARQYFLQVEKDYNSPEKIMARALRIADEELRTVRAQLAIAAPKVEGYEKLMSSKDGVSLGEVAKLLGTGQNRLFAFLRFKRILMDNNMPYQQHVDAGRFKIIEQTWTDKAKETHISPKTLATAKGIEFIRKTWETLGGEVAV